MLLLTLFAFLAGIVTIFSPCILPILPVVLSGSVTGGKRKPLGIIAGFVVSFTFFTLFLATIVKLVGIRADSLRLVSVIVIFLFGASLVSSKMQALIEQAFTKLSGFAPRTQTQSGFLGGVLIGISLGLIWTPCVGPILASVISLAITGQVSSSTFFITLAYSLGTALPMLAITYGGRELLQKHPKLIANTGRIQKVFGVLMIFTAIAIYSNLDRKFQTFILEKFPNYGVGLTKFEDNPLLQNQLEKLQVTSQGNLEDMGQPMLDFLEENLTKAPELIPGGQWFNSQPLSLKELRGKVVLVDFWTYSCINCIRTLPYLKSWHEKYSNDGLVIIGVHSPEFAFEKDADNVTRAIADFEIKYPVMQDNDFATWRAYGNRYWPAKYFIDKDGRIRWTHFGEGEYEESEQVIQTLLAETGVSIADNKSNLPEYQVFARTPELYLGYARIEYLASPEFIKKDQPQIYSLPSLLPDDYVAYQGSWTVTKEYAKAEAGSSLELNFEAKEVFLVMRPMNGEGKVKVVLDGKIVEAEAGSDVENGLVTVDQDHLYRLINLTTPGRHRLRLEFVDNNTALFAFTFG